MALFKHISTATSGYNNNRKRCFLRGPCRNVISLKNLELFIRDKPIFSSERLLHKDYDRKGSVAKTISARQPQEVWRQDELIGGKQPVVK
jgi:hypothetical protein